MLKLLLKKQMMEIFRMYFYDAKKNRARSKLGVIGCGIFFVVVMVGILGGLFTALSLAMCEPLSKAGVNWLYFSIMGLMAVLLGTFGSVFNTYSCLYLSKDNDLLLSLPIPVKVLVLSRLLSVYLMGLIYSSVVILPAIIVYCATVSVSISVIFGSLILILLISVFVLTLSCALGWVVAKISLKLKHKSMVTVIASIVFIIGYYFFYFKAQQLISDLLANAVVYGANIKGFAYPVYLFGRIAVGDVSAMLIFSAVIVGLFILMLLLITNSFIKTATSSGKISKKIYKERIAKQKGINFSLLSRELTRFTSNPTYMLNCGLGILILPLCGVMMLIKGDFMIAVLSEIFVKRIDFIPVLLIAVLCMLCTMNNITAPSISLEGKSLWLIQSLPISPWKILCAKLKIQLILTGIPALFCFVCIAFVYSYSLIELLLALLVLASFVLLYSILGMFFGIKMPNLNWTSEITPIKQSACVVITLLSGLAYIVLMCVGFILIDGWRLGFTGYMAVFGIATLALSGMLVHWLKNKGSHQFAFLQA